MRWLRLSALALLCLSSACTKGTIKDIPSQTWRGFEVKVLSVESKGNDYAKKNEALRCEAKEGSVVMVAEVAFKALSQTELVSLPLLRLQLEDMDGKRYESFGMPAIGQGSMNLPAAWEFCFEAPKGAVWKTLYIEELAFDLR